jgi:hypothetical protein
MTMTLETGESASRDFEVPHIEAHMLAATPDQNLA